MNTAAEEKPPVEEAQPPVQSAEEWRKHKNGGREYVPRATGHGLIWREGDETVEDARKRDDAHRDEKKPPRKAKTKRPPMPAGSRKIDLRELEKTLVEAFQAPAMVCATFGDEWGAQHFHTSAPYLARNLIHASEHNPWLRRKLEEAATGQDAMMAVVAIVGVGGALFAYAAPPIIFYLNIPVSEKTRGMLGIPPRRKPDREPEYAAATNGQPAESATGAQAPPPSVAP